MTDLPEKITIEQRHVDAAFSELSEVNQKESLFDISAASSQCCPIHQVLREFIKESFLVGGCLTIDTGKKELTRLTLSKECWDIEEAFDSAFERGECLQLESSLTVNLLDTNFMAGYGKIYPEKQ